MANDKIVDEDDVKSNGVDVLSPDYPLMVIMRSIPGTLSHSKNIALMMETIAPELGLDGRKLKIAAYYHDIGKSVNPRFFTENQDDSAPDPHKDLDAWISYRMITAHIGDTVQILVNDPNIPRDVIEWCSQHHGTCVVRYFCTKSGTGNEDNYRYKCSRPRSLEAALLMICDHLEARSRSLSQAGKLGSIDELVDAAITELLEEDEQLDDVALPKLGHLRLIKTLLKRELAGRYHKRVDYDKAIEETKGE